MANRQKAALDEIFQIAKRESLEEGREAHVAELLEAYLKFRPEHDMAWMIYGEALRILGRKDDAYNALTKAFDCAPDEYKSYVAVQLAMLLEMHASPMEASKWYETATDQLPGDDVCGWIWMFRGVNLAIIGENKKAIECFEKIIDAKSPEHVEALFHLGMLYRAMGDYDKAQDSFRRAVDLQPDYENAIEALEGLEGMSYTQDLIRKINGTIH